MAINADFNGADEVIPTTPLPPPCSIVFLAASVLWVSCLPQGTLPRSQPDHQVFLLVLLAGLG